MGRGVRVPAAAEPVVVADGEADVVLPSLIVDAGPNAVARFLEFFARRIANERTRAAYAQAVGQRSRRRRSRRRLRAHPGHEGAARRSRRRGGCARGRPRWTSTPRPRGRGRMARLPWHGGHGGRTGRRGAARGRPGRAARPVTPNVGACPPGRGGRTFGAGGGGWSSQATPRPRRRGEPRRPAGGGLGTDSASRPSSRQPARKSCPPAPPIARRVGGHIHTSTHRRLIPPSRTSAGRLMRWRIRWGT